ncbi:MAG: efflux RND transporter periplasmic adaptor subunit [Bacteroidetes bacterium]|uniref:efflux RND transporter periplasmic adaptor subunit n=1 Tax=Aquaticitalea lipolytica TaxID=1247562 RepID=UPI001D4D2050|nr:efflux RND transporter periplasmic adaptor subunit [Aquaticitalea lipolytica]MBU2526362.1 efflux RND transporter periplasmic adaptor subunit [Bacteroidota bacterium]
MKIKFNTKISLLILSILLLVACGNTDSEKKEASEESSIKEEQPVATGAKQITFTKDQYNLAGIETGAIEMRNLSNIIKLNGSIDVEPESMASVSAPLGGYLKTAGKLPGEEIKKGQVLATIENPEFIQIQQGYLESLSKLQFLEEEFNRQKKLREEDINSAKTFQQVSSDYKITQGRVKAYEQQLALAGISRSSVQNGNITRTANLYAPISGFVKASNVNIGDFVSPQDVLFEIVDLNDIHLALNAFEKDLEKLEIGQTVKFSLSDDNTFNRTAKVFLIGKATGSDRITPVYCHIEKENEKGLLPGMYVKAWIESGTNKQNAIPSEAIVQYEGKDFVILQTEETESGYTFKLEQVKKGIEQEGYTAITFAEAANVQNFKPVTKNAYSILSALRNSEEEE